MTHLVTDFEKKDPEAAGKTRQRRLIKFFRGMTSTQLTDYIRNHGASLYMATVSTNDILYLPAGYMVSENVGTHKHCTGLRLGFMLGAHIPLMRASHEKLETFLDKKHSAVTEDIIKHAATAQLPAAALLDQPGEKKEATEAKEGEATD